MKTIEFSIVPLDWIKTDYTSLPESAGIYQIYGTSPLYGMDTLLYIGQAKNLRHRVKGHYNKESFIGRQPNKNCRYALLSEDLLTMVEQTLIIMHKPSFNSASLIQVSSEVKKKGIYIQNHGDRGMLNIENTNYYFLNTSNEELVLEIMPPEFE